MNFDRRSEVRERVRLPVCLSGGRSGLTRDVSASGLSFDFNGRLEAGSTIELSIALPDNDRPMRLKAQGLVVRVEPRGSGYGVGVRMSNSTLEQVVTAQGDCRIPAVPKTHTDRQRHWH